MKWLIHVVLVTAACGTTIKVEPVKVQPIHITVDVNVHDRKTTDTGESTR